MTNEASEDFEVDDDKAIGKAYQRATAGASPPKARSRRAANFLAWACEHHPNVPISYQTIYMVVENVSFPKPTENVRRSVVEQCLSGNTKNILRDEHGMVMIPLNRRGSSVVHASREERDKMDDTFGKSRRVVSAVNSAAKSAGIMDPSKMIGDEDERAQATALKRSVLEQHRAVNGAGGVADQIRALTAKLRAAPQLQ